MSNNSNSKMNSADIIFIGDIITVDDSNPTVKALAVKNGAALAIGCLIPNISVICVLNVKIFHPLF